MSVWRYSSSLAPPISPTRTEKPSRLASPTTTRPLGPRASPALQAGSASATSGLTCPPSKGCWSQRPTSSPLESSNQTTRPPSGVSPVVTTPVGWSDTWRWRSAARSQAWACQEPERLET